ncbi:MAG: glycosyltransferase [Prevotella sp.]|jgi:glycosyltransferase involved in cell wall biosynthesis|nr:glycosyltransferase [Prevotella sp.]
MRILLANKFYYRRGGDCIYMLNLEQLFKKHGHEVAVFSQQYPQNLSSKWSKYFPSEMKSLKVLTRPFGDGETKRKFCKLCDDFHPDVVHLNNIHTQLSPVIAEIAHEKGIRLVWTLHDYKLLCPRYDCLRSGENCELCFDPKNKGNCFKYSCMKGGMIGSWIGYKEAKKWNKGRLESYTDTFICPSYFMQEEMEKGGFDRNKLITLCNFIDVEKCKRQDYTKENYYCYVGRLSHEKGVMTLLEAANRLPYRLVIIGDGPLASELKAKAHSQIEFVGYKDWDEIKELVGKAHFSVIPSEWYENSPLSAIEAKCLGTPVLGARIGGIPELIEEGKTGMTFESRNVEDLRTKIKEMWNTSFNYQQIAFDSMNRYNDEKYYKEIMKIYRS